MALLGGFAANGCETIQPSSRVCSSPFASASLGIVLVSDQESAPTSSRVVDASVIHFLASIGLCTSALQAIKRLFNVSNVAAKRPFQLVHSGFVLLEVVNMVRPEQVGRSSYGGKVDAEHSPWMPQERHMDCAVARTDSGNLVKQ